MSVVTSIKDEKQKVHFTQYIRSEDKPADEVKPVEETKKLNSDATEQDKPAEGVKPATPANS